jgi:predicted permease
MPLGRLSPGVTAREAAEELRTSFERQPKNDWRGLRAAAVPLPSLIVGDVRPALLLLSAAAAVLLLTACCNVGNLLLLRGSKRQHEIAVRQALGASRGRIARSLLVESLPLAAVAGLIGTGMATELVRLLAAVAPQNIPRIAEVRVAAVPLGLAALVGCAAALGSACIPVLWLSRDRTLLLGTGRNTPSPKAGALTQTTMVVLQMGFAVFVLFLAGLLGRTLQSLHAIDTGLAVDEVVVVELSVPERKFASGERLAALYDSLLARIGALPDVRSVSMVGVVPFTGATGGWDGPFVAEGQTSPPLVFNFAVVGAGYFETMGISLRSGRSFDSSDRRGSAPVAVVSERAAQLLGIRNGAVGRRIRLGESSGDWRTIVGVAAETRYRAIREPAPTVYLPVAQFSEVMPLMTTLVVRATGRPTAAVPSIRATIAQNDPDVSVLHAAALNDLVDDEFAGARLNAVLLSLFAAGGVLLAAVGLYSVLSAVVNARSRELAIRQAIGATPARIRGMVVVQIIWLAAAGLVLGLAGGVACARLLGAVLYGVGPSDVYTLSGVAVFLMTTAAMAGYVPARRATRPGLMAVLREG